MKLKDLKKAVDKTVEYAGDCDPDVEVWLGEEMFDIKEISQFQVVPTVTIEISKPEDMDKE